MKVTSARLAKIAGQLLQATKTIGTKHMYWDTDELQALAASVLSQSEPKPKPAAKRKVRK